MSVFLCLLCIPVTSLLLYSRITSYLKDVFFWHRHTAPSTISPQLLAGNYIITILQSTNNDYIANNDYNKQNEINNNNLLFNSSNEQFQWSYYYYHSCLYSGWFSTDWFLEMSGDLKAQSCTLLECTPFLGSAPDLLLLKMLTSRSANKLISDRRKYPSWGIFF